MNTIALRIQDHLKNIAPFSFLTTDEQAQIARAIIVQYAEIDEAIFNTSEAVKDCFFVVKEGAVGLYREDQQLVDQCDEGDIFGLRAMIRKDHYQLTAKTLEESILYAIPMDLYKSVIAGNTQAAQFIISSFAANTLQKEVTSTTRETEESIVEDGHTAKYTHDPVTCSADTTVEHAAQIMTVKRVGSLLIAQDNKPIGIITDKDLRTKIATGKFSIQDKVSSIMSAPVVCYPKDVSIAEAQIAMLQHKITHLCITDDGTANSTIVGVLSEHDMILIRENNPSVLIKQIKRCYSAEDLREIKEKSQELLQRYLQQQVSIVFITKIISEINNALTVRAIELAEKEMSIRPPVAYAWLSLGSQGRREQVLLTDQDNALVYEDSDDKTAKDYFVKLAALVNQSLHTIGFEYCPAEMMASNPKWCLPLSQWQQQFANWITTPTEDNIMLCTIFFDFEAVYGAKQLTTKLNASIDKLLDQSPIFFQHLGKNALQSPPPLSFFRQFLVEASGDYKDQFDIKARVMMPLVDAARLLCLSAGIMARNTIERYTILAQQEPQNEAVYKQCSEAFQMLLSFRTASGLAHRTSGRFVPLTQLSKSERLDLKTSFKAVKEIQNLVLVRFRLAQMM